MCCASLILALGMVAASMKLHSALVHNLMKSPMSFYDTTPLGRILNRVGKVGGHSPTCLGARPLGGTHTHSLTLHVQDMDTLDSTLPMTVRMFTMCVVSVVATLVVIIFATPVFVVVLPPLAIIYFYALVR